MKKLQIIFLFMLSINLLTANLCEAQNKKKSEFKLTKANKSMKLYEDNGITSPTQEKYLRNLVFSSTPFEKGKDNESDFKTEFTFNDNIYFRAYMPHSIYNHPIFAFPKGYESPKKNSYGEYYYKITVNGAPLVSENSTFWEDAAEDTKQTVMSGAFLPDVSIEKRDQRIVEALNKLEPGDYTIRLELHTYTGAFECREPLCAGEFTYKKTGTENISIGNSWSQYIAGMHDENLEDQIKEIMYTRWGNESKTGIVEVKIANKEWSIERNEITGIIISRYIGAYVCTKTMNGACEVTRYTFKQRYDGSEYSNNLIYEGMYVDSTELIDCD